MWIKCETAAKGKIRISAGGADGGFGEFHVGPESLNEASAAVYERLDDFVEWADQACCERDELFGEQLRTKGLKPDGANMFGLQPIAGLPTAEPPPQWLTWVDTQKVVRRRLLDSLVDVGRDLYDAVFWEPRGKAAIGNIQASMRTAYQGVPASPSEAAKPPDRRLVIQPHSALHVPWGLLFDPAHAVDAANDGDEFSVYGGFWAMRHDLSVTTQPPQICRQRRNREGFGVLSLVETGMQDLVHADLGATGHDEIFKLDPIGTAHSYRECTNYVASTPCVDILLHYFGHQDGQALQLGKERITLQKYRRLLDEIAARGELHRVSSFGLVFLNGCRSAYGRGDYSLRSSVAENPDFCGAIVTEAAVRRPFAAEFARRFINHLRGGRTISQAMTDLRQARELWPESLVYGCYASPDYCIRTDRPQGGGAA